jgi:hypothetical protein
MSTCRIFLSDLYMLELNEILHDDWLACWDVVWIFVEFFTAFSIWSWFFVSGDHLCKLIWHRLVEWLGNAHIVLYGHEIWYAWTRHILGPPCFGLIHFFFVFNEIWIFEVDVCIDGMNWSMKWCLFFCWFSLTWFHLPNWAQIWHGRPWLTPV